MWNKETRKMFLYLPEKQNETNNQNTVTQTGESDKDEESIPFLCLFSFFIFFYKHNPIIVLLGQNKTCSTVITSPFHHCHHNLVSDPNYSHLMTVKYLERGELKTGNLSISNSWWKWGKDMKSNKFSIFSW